MVKNIWKWRKMYRKPRSLTGCSAGEGAGGAAGREVEIEVFV
jgi:hypothetical protein